MKRILLLIDNLGSGGAQRQLVGLAKLLHDASYDVKVFYYWQIDFYKHFLDEAGVECECINGASNYLLRTFKIASAIRKFQPDVLISYLDTPNRIACLLKAIGGKYRLIVSERNTTQQFTLIEKVKFYMMQFADSIVPNSYSQEEFIKEHFHGLINKTHTITNFVDTNLFCPAKIAPKTDANMIVVGRVSEQKNVLLFLDAVKTLKDKKYRFHINWYGNHDSKYLDACKEKIAKLKIDDVFTFYPPTKEIIEEYWHHNAFCLPSIYEGFPNVVCEAMCCGLPILCSDVCDNSMIVEDGKNGYLFNPHSIDDMVEKIEKFLLLKKEQKRCMGEHSRELSLAKFSSKTFLEKYKALIEA